MSVPGLSSRARARAPWVALVVVVGVALGVGANHPSAPTASQRAAAIDASLRCPSCEDISVADSSAPTAVAIRQLVATRVAAGQSDAQIDAFLVSRYGPGILLRPPVSGITAAVWIVPLVAMAVAGACLAVVFWRRRRPESVAVAPDDRQLVARALAEQAAERPAGAIRSGTRAVNRPELDDERVLPPALFGGSRARTRRR